MRTLAWFAGHPIAANLLMGLVLAAGLLSLPGLRQETYPRPSFDAISVAVVYPGAPPDVVEEAVCVRIEEAIHGTPDVRRLRSVASEGFGSVVAELAPGADVRRVLDDVRIRVGALDTLPDEAEPAVVQELIDDDVFLSVAIHGDADERTLRSLGERLRDEIAALPLVSRAELVGARPQEIAIEVSEDRLRRFGLTFDDVVRATRASSLDLPGGALKSGDGEILLRTRDQASRDVEFERLPLRVRRDGTRVELGDVARVSDAYAEVDDRVRFDGKPAVMVRLMQRDARDQPAISAAVRAWLAQARTRLPQGVELALWNDVSEALESRRDLLLRNAGLGLALVVGVLILFLRLDVALWVGAGIPAAFVGALLAMASFDVSINMMSLFGFIVALGLVVDDAIIVGENIARHQDGTRDRLRAARAGVQEVAVPVLVAVTTSVLFLAPALSLPTLTGKVARALPFVVIACLVFSLLECLLVLPAHLAHGRRDSRSAPRRFARVLEGLRDRVFVPLLDRALRQPFMVLSLATVALLVAVALPIGGWVRHSFFPEVEADVVTAELVLPEGSPAEATWGALAQIERQAFVLREQLEGGEGGRPDVFRHVLSAVGNPPDDVEPLDFATGGGDGAHVGRVRIQLAPGAARSVSSLEVEERWRRLVGEVPGAETLHFSGSDISDTPPINLQLAGADRDALERATGALVTQLAGYPGVREVSDSARGGKRELRLRIRPEAEAAGLSLSELARQVRQGFHGQRVQHVLRGREEVPVVVRYPAGERRSLGDLERVWIRTPDGAAVPFSVVAEADLGRGHATLQRRDRRPTVNVEADVDPAVADANAILADLTEHALPGILADHPGVSFHLDGMKREESELVSALLRWWALALLAAYALLAVTLRSYAQPLLVLLAIPFGFVGAVAAHALLGFALSAFSLIGMVALSGVVVNDAVVLAHATNRARAAGSDLGQALHEAARARFRPILLTSLTTFCGLLPLLSERSAQAAWLQPMAATLAFGVLVATGVTLLVLPAAWLAADGVAGLLRTRRVGAGPVPARPGRDRALPPRWRVGATAAAGLPPSPEPLPHPCGPTDSATRSR